MTSENSGPDAAGPPPIRSILKKLGSSKVTSDGKPRLVKSGKSISFGTTVTTRWAVDGSELRTVKEVGNGQVGGAVGVASDGEPSPCSLSVETHDTLDMAGGEGAKFLRSSNLKTALKSKVGMVLRRSSRTQVQGDMAELEASGSGFSAERRCDRRVSEMSASAEHHTVRHMSLPRMGSLDSTDIFTRSNKSWRSKIAKFGKHFRAELHTDSEAGVPVLTKVTPLGG